MSDASLMAESYSEDHITQNTVMDEDNKPSCKFCGKKFAQSSYIKAHMRLHTGEKPFACSFCPKRFSDCSNWKKHERIHIRQMGGSLDKNSSSTNNNVKSSMLLLQSYQAPKPKLEIGNGYVCKICNKSFSNASSLTTHKRIHTGDRPYRCQTCGKSFTQIGTLRTHERIHTGEKPYVCKLCGQTFAQNGSYRMHERRHMMEMLHKCPICGIKFSQWEDAKAHIASHPEMAGCADFLKNHIPPISGSQESLNDDETLPPIESFTSRPDQMALDQFPPPNFPFPHQLSPFLNVSAASLHFGASLTADMPTPVSMFTSQVIKSEALNMQARSASQPNLYRHPVVTTSLPGQYTDQQTQDQNDTNIVSTTTARDRKYSSDSPTSRSMSTPEASLDNGGSRNETEKNSSETELNTMETGNKTASEDSSLTSDHSDNAASEEVHEIKSQNLHSRLISSSSRKQKHPMRRYSGSGSADPDTSTHPSQSLLNESDSIYSGDQSVEEFQDLSSVTGKLYRCEHCHIIFEDCTLYLLHNGFHSHDNDPFKCVICKSSCRDRIEFNCHLTSHIK